MGSQSVSPLPQDDLALAFNAVGEASWRQLQGARVFITGGTGFVGKWLLATLVESDRRLALGCEVVVLSRDPAAFAAAAPNLHQHVTLVKGDVRDFEFPAGTFSHFVHAATDVVAQNAPLDTFDTCVSGTRRVLDMARRSGAADVLLVSSGAIYGRQPPALERLAESYVGAPDPLATGSAYGEGKRVAEWLGAAYAAGAGLRVKTARCFAFTGPYLPLDKHFAIGNFLRDAMGGDAVIVQGDGTPYRSYLHAADMAAWLWAILLRGKTGAAYNVGGEEAVSIAELAHRIVRVIGSPARVETTWHAPEGGMPERYVPDVAKARSELALPTPLTLDEAIARTARWHRSGTAP